LNYRNAMSTASALANAATADRTSPAQEFAFSQDDFDLVCELIHQQAGIHLSAGKKAMVYGRLSRRLRQTHHQAFTDYLQWLRSKPVTHLEWQEFINCLTTNLTSFFREPYHFDELRRFLLSRRGRVQRIWCAAASTGEEPYSIAMTVVEALGADAPVRILASDIDTDVLAAAQRGVYPVDARGLTPERLRCHFLRGTGSNQGFARVKPELTRLIDFREFNLMSRNWSLGEPFDIVFCRNVMIYFDAPTQRRVLSQLKQALASDGLLFVGHSENFVDARDLFRLLGKTIYQSA
jgi:chemotaxis protein methyltransferase CheR